MKKSLVVASVLLLAASLGTNSSYAQDWGRLLQGGVELIQSMTVSDDQVKNYVSQFVTESDQKNQLAPDNGEYSKRLSRIVNGITSVDGQPLNFKVYITKDINAFACADGSVRVYSGLMDVMNDDEVLGVLGHEIGHVAHHDTRNAMKSALRTAAFKDALASTSGTIAALTDSQLGVLGEAIVNAKYSQKQESNADSYAYDFLKAHGRNPLVLCMAFSKLKKLEGNSGTSGLVSGLFSSHPDTDKRIRDIEKKAVKDGFAYPTVSSSSTGTSDSSKSSVSSKTSSKSSTASSKKSSKSKSSKKSKTTKSKSKKRR